MRCVWRSSRESITFFEDIGDSAFSSIYNSKKNNVVKKDYNEVDYIVESISLNDLLCQHNAPSNIDFLSIDTEGSEFDILSNFNFTEYSIKVICVEHNYSSSRDDIFNLLTRNGYKRKFRFLSRFDDWYVLDN